MVTEASNPDIWLTEDAHAKLTAELAYLKGEGRAEVSQRIAQAREEGDLSENGGYHAAREEQGQQEARIRQLEVLLRDARIGDAPRSDSVGVGMRVTIAYDGDPDDTETFLLGARELMGANEGGLDVISPQSPLGAAVMGLAAGDATTYTGPTGARFDVTVVDFAPHSG
jgi:transcription elongation factor GreA